MNGYLLDTHVLIWWLEDPFKLTEEARTVINQVGHPVFVSSAVAWEMAIKSALGRLRTPDDLIEQLNHNGIHTISITIEHGLGVADLPLHHRDPFDRIMVSQAIYERLVFVTRDAEIEQYDLDLLKG